MVYAISHHKRQIHLVTTFLFTTSRSTYYDSPTDIYCGRWRFNRCFPPLSLSILDQLLGMPTCAHAASALNCLNWTSSSLPLNMKFCTLLVSPSVSLHFIGTLRDHRWHLGMNMENRHSTRSISSSLTVSSLRHWTNIFDIVCKRGSGVKGSSRGSYVLIG